MATRIWLQFRVNLINMAIKGEIDRKFLPTVLALELTNFLMNNLNVGFYK